eukprot:5102061-Amphidinium_carterae.1
MSQGGLAFKDSVGAWLTAPPSEFEAKAIPAPLFQVALLSRLRQPILPADTGCLICGDSLDRFGRHSVACACGGDRIVRHNAVRDQAFTCRMA